MRRLPSPDHVRCCSYRQEAVPLSDLLEDLTLFIIGAGVVFASIFLIRFIITAVVQIGFNGIRIPFATLVIMLASSYIYFGHMINK